MDAMTQPVRIGVPMNVDAVKARIEALREEIRRLEESIGITSAPPQTPPPPPAEPPRRKATPKTPAPTWPAPADGSSNRYLVTPPPPADGQPEDNIDAIRELLRKGPGVASAK